MTKKLFIPQNDKLEPDNLSFSANDLENIVYALDVYITENDDKIADELKDICYKIEAVLEEEK